MIKKVRRRKMRREKKEVGERQRSGDGWKQSCEGRERPEWKRDR